MAHNTKSQCGARILYKKLKLDKIQLYQNDLNQPNSNDNNSCNQTRQQSLPETIFRLFIHL